MRRLLLIVMMCLLPLQFSWAAVAAVSAHAVQADAVGHLDHHGGHHDHGPASGQTASSDRVSADATAGAHDDGSTCHSHGHNHGSDVLSAAWVSGLPVTGRCFAAHRLRHVPDAVPDELLRPPLSILA